MERDREQKGGRKDGEREGGREQGRREGVTLGTHCSITVCIPTRSSKVGHIKAAAIAWYTYMQVMQSTH